MLTISQGKDNMKELICDLQGRCVENITAQPEKEKVQMLLIGNSLADVGREGVIKKRAIGLGTSTIWAKMRTLGGSA